MKNGQNRPHLFRLLKWPTISTLDSYLAGLFIYFFSGPQRSPPFSYYGWLWLKTGMKIDLVAKRCVDFWWEVLEKLFLKPQLTFQQDGMVASSSHNRTGKRSQRSKTPQSSQHNNQNEEPSNAAQRSKLWRRTRHRHRRPSSRGVECRRHSWKTLPRPVQNPGFSRVSVVVWVSFFFSSGGLRSGPSGVVPPGAATWPLHIVMSIKDKFILQPFPSLRLPPPPQAPRPPGPPNWKAEESGWSQQPQRWNLLASDLDSPTSTKKCCSPWVPSPFYPSGAASPVEPIGVALMSNFNVSSTN